LKSAGRWWGFCSGHGGAACLLQGSGAMAEPQAFANFLAYIEKEADTLKVLQCDTLKDCLMTGKATGQREGDSARFKHYKIYLTLQKEMSAEQRQVIEEWERRNCVLEAARFSLAFRKFCSVVEQHLEEMKDLRRATLKEVCLSYVAKQDGRPIG